MAKLKPAEIQPKVAKEIVLPTIPRPRLRRKPWRKTGPRLYRLAKDPEHLGGPGEPPVEFLSAQTTKTEWYVYWALSKLYDDPEDPRVGPYTGARSGIWQYQKFVEGPSESVRGNVRNLDFVAVFEEFVVGIRVQTERYHIMAEAAVQAKDFWLKTHIRGVSVVRDIFEQDFIEDVTGEAVCTVVANILRGIESPGPIRLGTARKSSIQGVAKA